MAVRREAGEEGVAPVHCREGWREDLALRVAAGGKALGALASPAVKSREAP